MKVEKYCLIHSLSNWSIKYLDRTHQSEGCGLNEGSLGEGAVLSGRFRGDSLPDEGLHHAVVVQVVEVGVCVDVAQRQAVQLCIGQRVNNMRLQVVLALRIQQ